jgi:hypothetical protein
VALGSTALIKKKYTNTISTATTTPVVSHQKSYFPNAAAVAAVG